MPADLFADRDHFLDTRTNLFHRLAPHFASIVSAAAGILRHDIQGWGDVSIQHGDVVDFNADYGQSGKYGFHYWWWSQPLIHAHLLTGDEAYLDEFERLFDQWYDQRPRVKGAFDHLDVIQNELGVGLRCRSFIEYLQLRPGHARVLEVIQDSGQWLANLQQQGYRAGNWQIMGAYGLARIATTLKNLDWLRLATNTLRDHADRDFFPDGGHSERVPASYAVVAYRDLFNLTKLSPDPIIESRLATIQHWFRAIMPPDRILPGINDGERTPPPDQLNLEPLSTSAHLATSGFTVMRSRDRYMLINHGPHGGGHSHADCFSFELHALGQPLAIDAGIGRTYDDPNYAPWYVRSIAHNMLVVDGQDLDRTRAVGVDVIWTVIDDVEYFAASHRGYEGVTHRRHIAFIRHEYWLIYDELHIIGNERQLSWNIHLTSNQLQVLSSPDWTRHESTGPASVRGIPGFSTAHAEIPWLSFERRAADSASIGVLLYPGDTPVRFTGNAGRFIVNDDQITFDSHGLHVQRRKD